MEILKVKLDELLRQQETQKQREILRAEAYFTGFEAAIAAVRRLVIQGQAAETAMNVAREAASSSECSEGGTYAGQ